MGDWRAFRRWSESELADRLVRAEGLARNFDPFATLTPETGWNSVHSTAVIAFEEPGPPQPDGAFLRVRHHLALFEHSDPRIVVGHFRKGAPLEGRLMLLELRSLGLHFLCPVRIGAVREEADAGRTLFAYSLETLHGHVERGREWFLLEKDHASGEVRFRIDAGWLPGDFPGLWARLGFAALGRRSQRAWHRLAHLRLRRIAAGLEPHIEEGPQGLLHEEARLPTSPVLFVAQRGLGRRRVDVEEEDETMRRNLKWLSIGIGALPGVRSFGALALLGRMVGRRRSLLRGRALPLLAAGEVVADKLPFTPARTKPVSLLARAAAGAFLARRAGGLRAKGIAPALLGGAAAVAATYGSFHLRRLAAGRTRVRGFLAALGEDALVIGASRRLAGALGR